LPVNQILIAGQMARTLISQDLFIVQLTEMFIQHTFLIYVLMPIPQAPTAEKKEKED
jgi:hypothetical protein